MPIHLTRPQIFRSIEWDGLVWFGLVWFSGEVTWCVILQDIGLRFGLNPVQKINIFCHDLVWFSFIWMILFWTNLVLLYRVLLQVWRASFHLFSHTSEPWFLLLVLAKAGFPKCQ
jgi:hypothetical protein